jgi:hypothetical protein
MTDIHERFRQREDIHSRFDRLSRVPTIGEQAESFLGSAADAASLHLMPKLAGAVHSGIDTLQDYAGPGMVSSALDAFQGSSFSDKKLQEELHGKGAQAYEQALRDYKARLAEQAPTAATAGDIAGSVAGGFAAPASAAGGITGLARNAAVDAALSGIDVYGRTGDVNQIPQAALTGGAFSAGVGTALKGAGAVARGVGAGAVARGAGTALRATGKGLRALRPAADMGAEFLDRSADLARRTDPQRFRAQVQEGIDTFFGDLVDPQLLARRTNEANAAAAGMRQVNLRNKLDQLPGAIEEFRYPPAATIPDSPTVGAGIPSPPPANVNVLEQSGMPTVVRSEGGVQGFGKDAERLGLIQPSLARTKRRAGEIMDDVGRVRGEIVQQTSELPLNTSRIVAALNTKAKEYSQLLDQEGVAARLRGAAKRISGRKDELTASQLWRSIRANRLKVKRNLSGDAIDYLRELEKIYDEALDDHVWAFGPEFFEPWKRSGRDYQVAIAAEQMVNKLIESGAANRSMSLTDTLMMGAGMAAGGPLGFAVGAVSAGANKLIRSQEKRWTAQMLQKIRDAQLEGGAAAQSMNARVGAAKNAANQLADASLAYPGAAGRLASAGAGALRTVGKTADVLGKGAEGLAAAGTASGRAAQQAVPLAARTAALQQERLYQGPVYDHLRKKVADSDQAKLADRVRRATLSGSLPQGTERLRQLVEQGASPSDLAAAINELQFSNPAFARWLRSQSK